jgi:hypothetical protein
MEIREIRDKVEHDEYEISVHAEKERYAEDITISDLETALCNGEVLENYPEDPRGPSCLVLGYSASRSIHFVCGYSAAKWVRIITVYIPKPPKWIDDRTRGRRSKDA